MEEEKETTSVSRLLSFIKGHQCKYVWAVISTIIDVALRMVPYYIVSQMRIALLEGKQAFSYYSKQCLWIIVGYLGKAETKLMQGKTLIVIAHRLSTIMDVDCIHVVKKGRIHTNGTYEERIKEMGIYANFIAVREQAVGWKL